ncbi:MAG: CHAD domain-containing protein [Acidobacteriia bacterium]|nr:CHAD domain-containing protein [Terriglobia bacterium]
MWRFEAEKAAAIDKWLSGPAAGLAVALDAAGAVEEHDLFADTDDRSFHRAGCALRVRRSEGRVEAAMVSLRPGPVATDPVQVPSQDPEGLRRAPDPLGTRVRAVAGPRPLRSVLILRTRRRRFSLRLHGRRRAELEIEEIAARRPDGPPTASWACALLTANEPEDRAVAGLASAMETEFGLAPAGETAFETALARLGIDLPMPPVSGAVSTIAEASVGALAYAVLRRHLGAFLANEPATRLGDDPEALHDMRVASRRLRAALALFEEVLPARARSFRRRLGRIGGALGEVRDLDVQLQQLDEFLRDAPAAERLVMQTYLETVAARRERARRRMLLVLDSPGYARLAASLRAFVEREPARRRLEACRPALAAAPDMILRRYRKVRRIGDRLAPVSPAADWHALRIASKRLRYALEFHAELYGKEASLMIDALVDLQDLLGLHQDAQVAMAHLEDICGPRGRRLARGAAFAMGRVAQRYAQRAEDLRGSFPRIYRGIRGKRWRRLREAMEAARPHA